MKRFLFVILALVMTIALIPAAFAEGEASDAGITVEYPFGLNHDDPTGRTYAATGGRIAYDSVYGHEKAFVKCTYDNYTLLSLRDNCYAAFKIRVPADGTYAVDLNLSDKHKGSTTGSGIVNVHILPVSETLSLTALTDDNKVLADVGKTEETAYSAENVSLSAGECYLVFSRNGFRTGTANNNDMYTTWLANMTLTSGEGTGRALIYADVNVEDEDAVLDAGNDETTKITLSNVFMSDGVAATENETADITYVSTDKTVASVSGDIVTAEKMGTTTIRAMSGDYVLGEKEIEVVNSKLSGVKVEYSFIIGTGKIEADMTYSGTNGKICFSSRTATNSVSFENDYTRLNTRNGNYVAFKIKVPASGEYMVSINLAPSHTSSSKGSAIVDVYVVPDTVTLGNSVLTNETLVISQVGATAETAYISAETMQLAAGEYYLVFLRNGSRGTGDYIHYTWLKDFTLDGGDGSALIWADMSLGETELEVDGTATLTSTPYMSTGIAATADEVAGITYTSTNTAVATISGTIVTATGAGTATIQAKNGNYVLGEVDVTVTAPAAEPEAAPETVSYGQYDNVNGKVYVKETTPGTELTFTAEDIDSYTFRYWVLGSAATGRYYSSEKSVTVTPYANIALTAIYTQNSDVKVVDLYNYNGEFLKTITALSDLADVQPAMIGHTFANKWLLADGTELTADTTLTETVTQAVAQYTKNTGYEAENINTDSTYGWTRNGKLVTYDEDYTFLTWLNSVGTIAKNEEEVTDRIPIAVLESKDDAYMLEYDKGAYEIVEVGILFGTTADPEVDSAYSKAKVKDIKAHGQFTASPMDSETYARGYVIYKDGDDYKVIYAD